MRIYIPADAPMLTEIAAGATELHTTAERPAWTVTREAQRTMDAGEEELEYEAMHEAIYVGFAASGPDERVLIVAGDVPAGAASESTADGGLYGVTIAAGTRIAIASVHVSELTAQKAAASDTDPAVLWFDVSEGPTAVAFQSNPEDAAGPSNP